MVFEAWGVGAVGAQMVGVIGVLALVTVVPGPDMAVVTQHAIASGRRACSVWSGLRRFWRPPPRRTPS
jgi:hypothetical protein